MPFSSNNLLSQLDQTKPIDWAVDLKYRDEAYAFLMRSLGDGVLNRNQTRNALHALFRIGFYDRSSEVLETFVKFAKNPEKGVRTEAVQLAIGLIRWVGKYGKTPLVLSPDQVEVLHQAICCGVSPKVERLVSDFFGTGG